MDINARKVVTSKFSRAAGWEYPPSLFPLPDPPWPARIEHLLVLQEKAMAVDELTQQLDLPSRCAVYMGRRRHFWLLFREKNVCIRMWKLLIPG